MTRSLLSLILTQLHMCYRSSLLLTKPNSESHLSTPQLKNKVTYARLDRSIRALAAGLYHGLGVRKGDVVFVLSPNSLLYPTICLAVLSIGAVLTTANPLNTAAEIAKQVQDSGTKLAIAAPEEMHKLVSHWIAYSCHFLQ
ncbi:4-coumarate--CoA ligase-like 8 [Abeliophyllum distichum]|uniref:4-coumarate--CoA ligase-like 8 n=1 Tax=Abeliophyllum distichum TaxID=126358 RepID=A0ABD1V994_9LAMI